MQEADSALKAEPETDKTVRGEEEPEAKELDLLRAPELEHRPEYDAGNSSLSEESDHLSRADPLRIHQATLPTEVLFPAAAQTHHQPEGHVQNLLLL